jgi:hypothetical protein
VVRNIVGELQRRAPPAERRIEVQHPHRLDPTPVDPPQAMNCRAGPILVVAEILDTYSKNVLRRFDYSVVFTQYLAATIYRPY